MKKEYDDVSLLSITEACEALHIGRRLMMQLIKSGRIQCVMLNKRIKISYAELKRFVNQSSFSNVDITNSLITYHETNSTTLPEFDTTTIFENLLEEYIHGECLHKGQ